VFGFWRRLVCGPARQLNASAQGWAQIWLKENPYTYRCRRSRVEYEQGALEQGHVAVNSILRDWIKGQVTAVECGILSFEAVFVWLAWGDAARALFGLRATG
jgi:hypothetical protein